MRVREKLLGTTWCIVLALLMALLTMRADRVTKTHMVHRKLTRQVQAWRARE